MGSMFQSSDSGHKASKSAINPADVDRKGYGMDENQVLMIYRFRQILSANMLCNASGGPSLTTRLALLASI